MVSNWRLHVKYIHILSDLATRASNKKEACDKYVVPIVNFAKSASASLPVKKASAECLANLVANVANNNARKLVHHTMTKEILMSETSQQRLVWLLFLESLLPQISSKHFK
jgi:hypothetical protein